MKNLKKLDREQLKSISGEGLLDPVLGLVGGVLGAVGGVVGGVLGVASGTVTGVVSVLENGLCQVQCEVNHVIHIRVLNCGARTCQ
ncbi:bacteriocin-like protein [Chryseobacterium sp. PMSZPI]|uniref:bacteriocin-like protein n=1 Tax=Chryseobacterium sp. PMSZPI TaxID=1033900 RepID=UPI00399FED3B